MPKRRNKNHQLKSLKKTAFKTKTTSNTTRKNPQSRSPEHITKGEIVKTILMAIGTIGAVGAVLAFPGLAYLVPLASRKRYSYDAVRKAVYRLDKQGLLVLKETGKEWKIQLTQKGHAEFLEYQLGHKGIPRPKTWDGRWHLLIFDIPEKRKYVREKIRLFLRGLGFIRLQDSVWVHPYECKEVLKLLQTKYHVAAEALYIRADWIDHDSWLRKDFHLQQDNKKR